VLSWFRPSGIAAHECSVQRSNIRSRVKKLPPPDLSHDTVMKSATMA